jgi:hypothetical protein
MLSLKEAFGIPPPFKTPKTHFPVAEAYPTEQNRFTFLTKIGKWNYQDLFLLFLCFVLALLLVDKLRH